MVHRKRVNKSTILLVIFLTVLGLFMLLPIFYIFNHAFKPQQELFLFPPTFFVQEPTAQNFENLFFQTAAGGVVPLTRYLFNSVLITITTLVSVIFVSSLAAYVISKFQFHFRPLLLGVIMISLMFASETVSIPRYLIISGLGISDTYFAHILPFLAAPVSVFLMKQFIDQIPNEILEAARMDGSGTLHIFVKIVLPTIMPAIATVAILTFQSVWIHLEASSLYIHDETMKTFAYYVSTIANNIQNNIAGQGIVAAAGLLLFIPNLIIFLVFQRYVMETMLNSGIK